MRQPSSTAGLSVSWVESERLELAQLLVVLWMELALHGRHGLAILRDRLGAGDVVEVLVLPDARRVRAFTGDDAPAVQVCLQLADAPPPEHVELARPGVVPRERLRGLDACRVAAVDRAPTRVQQPGRDRRATILDVALLQVLGQAGVVLGRRLHAPVNRLPVLVGEALLEKLHLLALVEVAAPKQLKLLVQRCRARDDNYVIVDGRTYLKGNSPFEGIWYANHIPYDIHEVKEENKRI